MTMHFMAKDVYLVMSSENSGKVKITLESPQAANQSDEIDQNGEITINEATLYHIVSLINYRKES